MTAERLAKDIPVELPGPARVEFPSASMDETFVRRTRTCGDWSHEPAVRVLGLGGNSLNWVDLAEMLFDRSELVSRDLRRLGATEPLVDRLWWEFLG